MCRLYKKNTYTYPGVLNDLSQLEDNLSRISYKNL